MDMYLEIYSEEYQVSELLIFFRELRIAMEGTKICEGWYTVGFWDAFESHPQSFDLVFAEEPDSLEDYQEGYFQAFTLVGGGVC
jgi:hypothetical protein